MHAILRAVFPAAVVAVAAASAARPGASPVPVDPPAKSRPAAPPGALPPKAGKDAPPPPPWVFRGALEGESGPMVFLALNERMTLAYDEAGGSLCLAWGGKAVPAGPAAPPPPGSAPLPAFSASGPAYHRRAAASPWTVTGPKGSVPVTVRFEGASSEGDLARLAWTLRLPGGRRIEVAEVPMFDDHYGDAGLFRNFTVQGIPPGHRVRLDLSGRGWTETWGGGGDGALSAEGGGRALVQEHDGGTPLKVTWSPPPAGGRPSGSSP